MIASATDGIQSIKKAVGFDGENSSSDTKNTKQQTSNVSSEATDSSTAQAAPEDIQRARSKLPQDLDLSSSPFVSAAPESDGPTEYTSPAKVIKMPSKKKKAEPEAALATPSEQDTSPETEEQAMSATAAVHEMDTGAGSQEVVDGPAAMTSAAQIKRAPSKKKPGENEEPDAAGAPTEASITDELPSESSSESTIGETDPNKEGPEEKPKTLKASPKPTLVSKAEHSVRSFRALQSVLTNPVWAPIVLDMQAKPSSLFSPREKFDTQFSDPVFRDGLKSASRLATTYAFETEKMRFNEKVIERVTALDLDPEGKIKPHTENITSVIDESITEEVLKLLQNGHVKHLLFSVGTRLGTFVPTMESLARIYLSLRKKDHLSSGDRLKIQEEILMRYKKAAYTEEMGKKARNLALNYFMDYLAEYGLKLYQERFKDVPEGQHNADAHFRRYSTITSFCCNTIEEWGIKIALSAQAIDRIKNKFNHMAGQHFRDTVGEPPPEV